jgi:hypothetical protein
MSDDPIMRSTLANPERKPRTRNGVPLLPRRPAGARRPTLKLVNQLRDDA